jgi:hypothetical protein
MNHRQRYSRVNMASAIGAGERLGAEYSRVNSEPPWPRPHGAPSIHKAPDRRGFVVYGAAEGLTKRRSAVILLPK